MLRSEPERRRGTVRRWLLPLAGATTAGAALLFRFASSPDPETLVRQANAVAETDPVVAEELLRKAIALADGRSSEAEIELCQLTALRGNWEDALQLFRGLDLPTCPDAFLLEFGGRAHKAGHLDEALRALSELRARPSPARLQALDALFLIYRDRGDDSQVLACVREMADLENNRPEFWWKLIELLDERNMATEAISALRQALARNLPPHDDLEMRHQLVSRLVDQGAAAEARTELELLTERESDSARVKLHEAAIYRLEGQPELALEAMELAMTPRTTTPGSLHLRALIYLDLKRYREAADDLQAEIAERPFDLVAHFKLTEAYRGSGEADLAAREQQKTEEIRHQRQRINELREFLLQHPDDRDVCVELAGLYRELDDGEQAARWEQRAAELAARPGQQP